MLKWFGAIKQTTKNLQYFKNLPACSKHNSIFLFLSFFYLTPKNKLLFFLVCLSSRSVFLFQSWRWSILGLGIKVNLACSTNRKRSIFFKSFDLYLFLIDFLKIRYSYIFWLIEKCEFKTVASAISRAKPTDFNSENSNFLSSKLKGK